MPVKLREPENDVKNKFYHVECAHFIPKATLNTLISPLGSFIEYRFSILDTPDKRQTSIALFFVHSTIKYEGKNYRLGSKYFNRRKFVQILKLAHANIGIRSQIDNLEEGISFAFIVSRSRNSGVS